MTVRVGCRLDSHFHLPPRAGVVDDSGPRTGLYWAINTSCMRWPTVKLAYECYCTGMSGCRHRHSCGMAAATCENATIHRVVMRLRMAKNGQLALPSGAPAGLAHPGVSPRERSARGGGVGTSPVRFGYVLISTTRATCECMQQEASILVAKIVISLPFERFWTPKRVLPKGQTLIVGY